MTKLSTAFVLSLTWAFFSVTSAHADHAPGVMSFTGCWKTEKPAPIVILGDEGKPDNYQVFREHMLLTVSRIEDTDLVRGDYYAFAPDQSSVIGPVSVDGAYNPVEHVLTVGEPKGGLNRVHAVSPDRIVYVHTKAAETADMSVRYLQKIDCTEADAKRDELKAAQNK